MGWQSSEYCLPGTSWSFFDCEAPNYEKGVYFQVTVAMEYIGLYLEIYPFYSTYWPTIKNWSTRPYYAKLSSLLPHCVVHSFLSMCHNLTVKVYKHMHIIKKDKKTQNLPKLGAVNLHFLQILWVKCLFYQPMHRMSAFQGLFYLNWFDYHSLSIFQYFQKLAVKLRMRNFYFLL